MPFISIFLACGGIGIQERMDMNEINFDDTIITGSSVDDEMPCRISIDFNPTNTTLIYPGLFYSDSNSFPIDLMVSIDDIDEDAKISVDEIVVRNLNKKTRTVLMLSRQDYKIISFKPNAFFPKSSKLVRLEKFFHESCVYAVVVKLSVDRAGEITSITRRIKFHPQKRPYTFYTGNYVLNHLID